MNSETTTDGWTALDPDEGPTVWAKIVESNEHTVQIAEGSDPEDPLRELLLSRNEIDNLTNLLG